jgi:PAS domain S-box-containing protein
MDTGTLDRGNPSLPLLRVLILEDSPGDTKLMAAMLEQAGYAVQFEVTDSPELFRERLEEAEYDVILADFNLRAWTTMDALEILRQSGKDVPLIVVTGSIADEAAAECIKRGAADYVLKDRPARLAVAVRRALEERRLREERKRAQEALRLSQEMFQKAFHASPDIMVLHTLSEGRHIDVNESFLRIFGYRREEVVGRTAMELGLWLDLAERSRFLRILREQGRVRNLEVCIRTKSGEPRTLLLSAEVIEVAAHGSVVTIGKDITERKLAEEALRESEENYRELAESISDVFFAMDKELRYTYWNEASEKLTGVSAKDALGKSLYELFPDMKGTSFANLYLDTLKTGQPHSFVNQYQLKGEDLIFELNVYPTHRGLCVIAKDITERTRAQQALQESEERFRSLVENAPIGIYRATPDGRVLMANPTLLRMLGYDSFQELASRNLESEGLEPSYPRSAFRERVERDGKVKDLESVWMRRDGSPIVVRESARVVRANDGRVLHYEGIVEDITMRKRAEESMRQLSGRLLRLQDEERRRIARELHDTTAQSLAALAINLSRVKESVVLSDPAASGCLNESLELAEQCSREVRTLSYLLHPPLLEETGLASALRWYAHGFARRSGMEVQLEISPEFGRLPNNVELALYRIVRECLTNVHIHSQSKTASIRLTKDPHQIVLTVADAGRGIPPDVLERASAYAPELGVGIPGMRERMRELGGRLEVSSGRQGTTVRAILSLG